MCTKGSLRQFRWALSPPGLLFYLLHGHDQWCYRLYFHVVLHIYISQLNYYALASTSTLFYVYAVGVWRHSPGPFVRCHECCFTHSQFHSRRYSLRITLKYTTLVRMRSGSAWTGINDNGAEVTNGLQYRINPLKTSPDYTRAGVYEKCMLREIPPQNKCKLYT